MGCNFTRGKDISYLVKTLKVPVIDIPLPLLEETNALVTHVWQKITDTFVDCHNQQQENIGSMYSLFWVHCTDIMKQQLESLLAYVKLNEDQDNLGLLIKIKNIAFSFQRQTIWLIHHMIHSSASTHISMRNTPQMLIFMPSPIVFRLSNTIVVHLLVVTQDWCLWWPP